jgi:hypothetical protein
MKSALAKRLSLLAIAFLPLLSCSAFDSEDAQRAAYWKERGYSFSPSYMTAWSMDAATGQSQRGQVSSPSYGQTPFRSTELSTQPTRSPAPTSSVGTIPSPSVYPSVGENGSYYGEPNAYGVPKTVYVNGYYRSDGTYVRSHFRSSPRR